MTHTNHHSLLSGGPQFRLLRVGPHPGLKHSQPALTFMASDALVQVRYLSTLGILPHERLLASGP